MIESLIQKIKGKHKRIVFTEGEDPRILEASARLHQEEILDPLLLGNEEAIKASAKSNNIDISGIEIINPATYEKAEMIDKMVEVRRGKMTREACEEALNSANYFGTMLVKMGKADGLLGGATYSTADTVRPALQLIKTSPGNSIVSSCFIMLKDDERLVMADCAINLNPSDDELVEIALQTAKSARVFGIEPIMGLLSYSTLGSGKGESVEKVKNAVQKLKNMEVDFAVDGEMQFDACISKEVASIKAKNSKVAGNVNTFIFPNIDAGNIGYKIAARLGKYAAVGPILQGLNAPVNDLSRGCDANEVYLMAIITAAQENISKVN